MVAYERRDVLPAVGIAILRDGIGIPENERNLDNSRQSSCHQSVPKHRVDHRAKWQVLGMGRHSPASDENHETWNEIPLWTTVTLSAQPDTSQTCAPPNDTHGCMLDIVRNPRAAPSVLREGIDATPCRDQERIEEFL